MTKHQEMAKHTKEELAEIYKQEKELFELLLKKVGLKRKDLYDLARQEFVVSNIDELTKAEKKQFDKLVFGVNKKRRFKSPQQVTMRFTINIEEDEETGWYVGQCYEIPSAMSQGKTIKELKENMKEAIELAVGNEEDRLQPWLQL